MTEIGYTRSEFFQMLNEVAPHFNPPKPHAQPTAAQESYAAHLASIGRRLTMLVDYVAPRAETALETPSVDWRDVGDAAYIDDLLAMACEFLEMEPETPHPVKYAVYLSPKQGEAAMILGDGSVNAGIVKALDLADHVGEARCQVCQSPHMLGYICEGCYEDRCA